MEEKKKWYYTMAGKGFRRILCMATFVAFMASLFCTATGVMKYGKQILNRSPLEFCETTKYQDDLRKLSTQVLFLASELEKIKDDQFQIVDTEDEVVTTYDLKKLFEDEEFEAYDGYSSLMKYQVEQETEESRYDNYAWAVKKLEKLAASQGYLHFTQETFQNLFEAYGRQNTGYRFSTEFSNQAYFVFVRNNEVSSKNQTREMDYAVYDPEQNLYYTTVDDYFDPYANYYYSCSDILEQIKQNVEETDKVDNLVWPILWSENLVNVTNVIADVRNAYANRISAAEALEALQEDAYVYCIKGDTISYNNGLNQGQILELPGSICVTAEDDGYSFEQTGNVNTQSDDWQEAFAQTIVENIRSQFPDQKITMTVGMDTTRNVQTMADLSITEDYQQYCFMTAHARPALIVLCISLVLLIGQAVSLILTTGRHGKKNPETGENTEVFVHAYDKLCAELWIPLSAAALVATVLEAMFVGPDLTDQMHWYSYALDGILFLPFAIVFMEVCLSFARRVKAHNFWWYLRSKKHVVRIRKVFGTVWKKCTGFYERKNGAQRFWFLCKFYICVMIGYIYMICIVLARRNFSLELMLLTIVFAGISLAVFHAFYCIYRDLSEITHCVEEITKGNLDSKCAIGSKKIFLKELSDGVDHIGDGLKAAVETSLKDERMKTELITNVSHDLKTPLTSIINYVDLLKKEDMPTEEAKHYLEVLEAKSQRLKHLTEDLVEAAKANSGNIELECMPLAFDELMRQAIGEFEDKFAKKQLTVIAEYPKEPAIILADGRRLFRIIENVLQNAYKYALEGTRIYAQLTAEGDRVVFVLKNISASPLNIRPEELMERFTRGDASRTTEGSGLGLSIAKDLTRLMNGTFEILLDGDLFKVLVTFQVYQKEDEHESRADTV